MTGRSLTKEEIWTALELRKSTYYAQLEKGTLITADNLRKAAANLGVNAAELLTRYRFIDPVEVTSLAQEIGGPLSRITSSCNALPHLRHTPVGRPMIRPYARYVRKTRRALTPGQTGDNPELLPLVDGYFGAAHRTETARDVRLIADKAYSHPSTRAALRRRGIKHTIPERDDQIARRKAKGSAGGRPPAFDTAIYKQRNTVERGFNRLKQWRGIATRYDKYALTFLGGVLLATSILRSRTPIQN
jgi:putative transposase